MADYRAEPAPGSSGFRSQGAEVLGNGVRYRTWSESQSVAAVIVSAAGEAIRTVLLHPDGAGYFSGFDAGGAAGDLYKYRLGENKEWPDPASRFQPFGVHGPSMVIDPKAYEWTDAGWSSPAFSELVIYELHVGVFTTEGTFQAAISRLAHLAALGVTAIELMPVADFFGDRNWGYDGVSLYAPSRVYGRPDDLRMFVDAAHGHGLAVILDVVYNHFGPDGNYTGAYHSGYCKTDRDTGWGCALNYSTAAARAFFTENAPYWMREFHVDGFRLDATHAMADDPDNHILREIGDAVHALGGFVIAEDERNDPGLLLPTTQGGIGLDATWTDDFHHVVRVLLTGQRESYYANFDGTSTELVETMSHGWLFRGQSQRTSPTPRGGDPSRLAPHQFVYCISNHDQVGNQAFGERLNHLISHSAYRAASALLCLVPQTPMIFMGQEWAASTPFQFFTDHKEELGEAVTRGRRNEFKHFEAFSNPATRESIPDPQAKRTFLNSKLRWEERHQNGHGGVLLLYWECLALRANASVFRCRTRDTYVALELAEGILALLMGDGEKFSHAVITDLTGGHPAPNLDDPRLSPGGGQAWKQLLSSNEARFGGTGAAPFSVPTTLVLEAI